MSEPQNVGDATSATGTSAGGQQADTGELRARNVPVPPTWWSPSGREWFSTDDETGLHSVGEFISPAVSLPSDAVRLVPVGPLLWLIEQFEGSAKGYKADAEQYRRMGLSDDDALGRASAARTHATQLRALLDRLTGKAPWSPATASLLGETPEPTALESNHVRD